MPRLLPAPKPGSQSTLKAILLTDRLKVTLASRRIWKWPGRSGEQPDSFAASKTSTALLFLQSCLCERL